MYGTAWKKEKTTDLVVAAVRAGFRGIDTACQPKHYYEPGVGQALQRLAAEDGIQREEIFLQTKFTPLRGQDPKNVPYDTNAPLPVQVQQSLATSLRNLQTTYIDSLVLHSPLDSHKNTMVVWREFEAFVRQVTQTSRPLAWQARVLACRPVSVSASPCSHADPVQSLVPHPFA